MLRLAFHGCIFALLTGLTQLGEIAWVLARFSRWPVLAFEQGAVAQI